MKFSPSAKPARRVAIIVLLIAFAGPGINAGCVRRQLTVTSQPSGALVYLNEREAGRTPFTTDFLWYGKYDVVVRKEGFETIKSRKAINAPWWGFPPFDLIAELMPWHPTDARKLNFTLTEKPADPPPESIIERGLEMRRQLPATQPATTPAS